LTTVSPSTRWPGSGWRCPNNGGQIPINFKKNEFEINWNLTPNNFLYQTPNIMHIETPPTDKPYDKPEGERRGLIIVNTGDGKGKSTAAFGLALRAHGRGKAVKIFQFMKVPTARFGEHRMFEQLGIPIEGLGDGFSWKSQDLEHSAQLARDGWQKAKAAILSSDYFMVTLDEVTYPLIYGWLPLADVLETLRNRPSQVHVVLTGRRCPAEIIALADTVTEMQMVKHAFKAGIPAQRGIED